MLADVLELHKTKERVVEWKGVVAATKEPLDLLEGEEEQEEEEEELRMVVRAGEERYRGSQECLHKYLSP